MTQRRDRHLRDLLPSKDHPYDHDKLDQAEIDALEAALDDGFGDKGKNHEAVPAPIDESDVGLLTPLFFQEGITSYSEEEGERAFYDAEGSAPCDEFPLGFSPERLRIYFDNQLNRFIHALNEQQVGNSYDRYDVARIVSEYPYSKTWYEHHACQLLDLATRTVLSSRNSIPRTSQSPLCLGRSDAWLNSTPGVSNLKQRRCPVLLLYAQPARAEKQQLSSQKHAISTGNKKLPKSVSNNRN
jgi:hypothetical protein